MSLWTNTHYIRQSPVHYHQVVAFYTSFHFASIVVKVDYIFLIALDNVLVIHVLLLNEQNCTQFH